LEGCDAIGDTAAAFCDTLSGSLDVPRHDLNDLPDGEHHRGESDNPQDP
jgi:hypothetical protein